MSNQPPPYNPPGAPMGGPAGPKPDNYLVWAILSTLFCCLPLGIASIVFAAQVDGKYNSGDYVGAQASSASAKKFATATQLATIQGRSSMGRLMPPRSGR